MFREKLTELYQAMLFFEFLENLTVGQGPIALAVGAGGGGLDIFTLIYPSFPLSPSLWETARYRLKYCLKGPLNPKPTNQPILENQTDIKLSHYYAELIQNLLTSFLEAETVLNNCDRELLFYFKGLLCVLHNYLTDYYRHTLTRLTRGKTVRLVPERKSKVAEVIANIIYDNKPTSKLRLTSVVTQLQDNPRVSE